VLKRRLRKKNKCYSAGSGTLQWSDCSPSFADSLEDQYQAEQYSKIHTHRQWDSISQSYVPQPFMHDLSNMSQLDFSTKVQKPLRRCLLSHPLLNPSTPKRNPIFFDSDACCPSRHAGEEDGTAEPAASGATTAAISLQLPGSSAIGSAGTAAIETNTAVAARSFSFNLSDINVKKLQDVLQPDETEVGETEVAAP
jgi:hypothetical protein